MSEASRRGRFAPGEQASSWGRVQWPLVLGLLVVFVALGIQARRVDAFAADVRFTRWAQGHDWRVLEWGTEATNWAMNGTPVTIGGLIVVLFLLLRGMRIDAAMLAVVILVRAVNSGLKWLFASPRPRPDLVDVIDDANNFGFPSGHAANALLVVGAIAWIATRHVASPVRRAVIWVVAVAWIVLTGMGRVRVGVHWPSDVLGAWLWSIAALIVITWVFERLRLHLNRPPREGR